MRIAATDIKDKKEFTFDGDRLVQVKCLDADHHVWLYERYNSYGRLFAYELVKGVKRINPDGQIVYKYPSSEQFGTYGYFIAKNRATEKHIMERTKELVDKKRVKTPKI